MLDTPEYILHNAILTLNFLNASEKRKIAVERHWIIEKNYRIKSLGIL